MKTERKSKNFIERVVFDFMLILTFYVPFVLYLISKHPNMMNPATAISLSGLGWRVGDLAALVYYATFLSFFMVYQTLVFLKAYNRKDGIHYTILSIIIVGAAFTIVGVLMPIKGNVLIELPDKLLAVTDNLHMLLCQAGPIMMILSFALMLYLYLRHTENSLITKIRTTTPAILIAAFVVLGTLTLPHWVCSVFVVIAVLMFTAYLVFFNVSYELAQKVKQPDLTPKNKKFIFSVITVIITISFFSSFIITYIVL